jgi:signal transduction histidine kinase
MPLPIDKTYASVKVSELQLRERNRALAVLLDMSNFLTTTLSVKEILDGALAKVLEFFDLAAGRIYLVDETGQYLLLGACIGVDSTGLERVKIGEGFSGRAARTRSFIAQHVSELEDKVRAELLLHKGFQIVICVPLIAMDQVLGVMNLAASRVIEFDSAQIDLLISIGNQIAVAINNARLYEDLQSKVKELKLQKEAIEFFAYSISHDLKSPAIGIHGLTSRLHKNYRSCLDDKGQMFCDQILKAAEQIARLVDRINAYIMAKESILRFEEIPLKELSDAIRTEFSDVMAKRGVTWQQDEASPILVGDRLSLLRVLRNLVDNALKYGGNDLHEVRITYREEPDHHVISVGDDGIALKVGDPATLFQLFRRDESARGIEGTGLGLATVKEFAERHGGRVWLETGTEKGTTFSISISKRLKIDAEP